MLDETQYSFVILAKLDLCGRRGFEDHRAAILRIRMSIDETPLLQAIDDRRHRAPRQAEVRDETLHAGGTVGGQQCDHVEFASDQPVVISRSTPCKRSRKLMWTSNSSNTTSRAEISSSGEPAATTARGAGWPASCPGRVICESSPGGLRPGEVGVGRAVGFMAAILSSSVTWISVVSAGCTLAYFNGFRQKAFQGFDLRSKESKECTFLHSGRGLGAVIRRRWVDVALGFKAVIERAELEGLNLDRVFLVGHSSGAQFAVLLALDPRWLEEVEETSTRLAGVVSLSGILDLSEVGAGLPDERADLLKAFPAADDRKKTSPMTHVDRPRPEMLVKTAARDVASYADMATRFVTAARPKESGTRKGPRPRWHRDKRVSRGATRRVIIG